MNCTNLQKCANELIPHFEKRAHKDSLSCMSGPYAALIQGAVLAALFTGTRLLHYYARGKPVECIPLNGEKASIFLNGYSPAQKVSFVSQVVLGIVCLIEIASIQFILSIYAGLKTPEYGKKIESVFHDCKEGVLPSNTTEIVINILKNFSADYQRTSKTTSLLTTSLLLVFSAVSVLSLFCLEKSLRSHIRMSLLVISVVAINLLSIAFEAFSYDLAFECRYNPSSELSMWSGCYQNYTKGIG